VPVVSRNEVASVERGLMMVDKAKMEQSRVKTRRRDVEVVFGRLARWVTKDLRTVNSRCTQEAEMMSIMCSFHASAGTLAEPRMAEWAFRIRRRAREAKISSCTSGSSNSASVAE
jgi:hypothetical protein